MLFDALAMKMGDGDPDDETKATIRDLVVRLMCDGALDEDTVDHVIGLEDADLWGLCTGIYSSASSMLGWDGPMMRIQADIRLESMDGSKPRALLCGTDWLCDIRGTPALVVRRDCLGPEDAEFYTEKIGRALIERDALEQDPANRLGRFPRTPRIHEWLLGEDMMDQLLSVLCIQLILYRALCDCLGNAGGVRAEDAVDAAFSQETGNGPVTGKETCTGIEGRMLLESVERFVPTVERSGIAKNRR